MASELVDEFHSLIPGTSDDPYATLKKIRDNPVFYSDLIDGWVVSRWSDVSRDLQDTESLHLILHPKDNNV